MTSVLIDCPVCLYVSTSNDNACCMVCYPLLPMEWKTATVALGLESTHKALRVFARQLAAGLEDSPLARRCRVRRIGVVPPVAVVETKPAEAPSVYATQTTLARMLFRTDPDVLKDVREHADARTLGELESAVDRAWELNRLGLRDKALCRAIEMLDSFEGTFVLKEKRK